MKNNKRLLAGALSVAFLAVPTITVTSCTSKGEQVDKTKTQLYINNFCRGFGGEWLTNYKKEFETLHANDSYEEGKQGVQIFITNSNAPAESRISNILSGRDEIYFTEQTSYYTLLDQDVIGDLTDCVTEKLTAYGETRSIEDKLTEDQKNYLKVDGKYYAIPHYSGYFGLTYDVDLFEKKNLYFNEDCSDFVIDSEETRSAGPDGVKGTSDDGLPATYEQFYRLCDFMLNQCNITPIVASGQSAGGYMNLLVNSLFTKNVGKEQMNLVYSCNGTLKQLAYVDNDGNVVNVEGETTITPETGYLSYQMRGRYDAFKFYETLIKGRNGKRYTLDKMDSPSYSAGSSQDDFLCSSINGASDLQPIGMIAEGNWWVNEASGTFTRLSETYGSQYSMENRRLAFMPLPKVSDDGDYTNTIFDHLSAIMFIKKNVDEAKLPLVKEFLKFVNSDASLVSFTVTTNTMKALNYEIPTADLNKMNYYGKSLYELQKSAEIVYPYNTSNFFRNNSTFFKYENQCYSKINNTNIQYIYQGIKNGATAEQYFKGMGAYYQEDWANRNLD